MTNYTKAKKEISDLSWNIYSLNNKLTSKRIKKKPLFIEKKQKELSKLGKALLACNEGMTTSNQTDDRTVQFNFDVTNILFAPHAMLLSNKCTLNNEDETLFRKPPFYNYNISGGLTYNKDYDKYNFLFTVETYFFKDEVEFTAEFDNEMNTNGFEISKAVIGGISILSPKVFTRDYEEKLIPFMECFKFFLNNPSYVVNEVRKRLHPTLDIEKEVAKKIGITDLSCKYFIQYFNDVLRKILDKKYPSVINNVAKALYIYNTDDLDMFRNDLDGYPTISNDASKILKLSLFFDGFIFDITKNETIEAYIIVSNENGYLFTAWLNGCPVDTDFSIDFTPITNYAIDVYENEELMNKKTDDILKAIDVLCMNFPTIIYLFGQEYEKEYCKLKPLIEKEFEKLTNESLYYNLEDKF